MISKRVVTVIKREMKMALGKSFIFATILIPIVMFAIVAIQVAVSDIKSGAESPTIVVLDAGAPFESILREELDSSKELVEAKIVIEYVSLEKQGIDDLLGSRREELLGNDNMGLVYIPSSAAEDKRITYYSANPANAVVRNNLSVVIDRAMNRNYFVANGIQNVDLKRIANPVTVAGNKVSADGTAAESFGPIIVAGTLAVLLLFGVSFNSMPVMNMVVNEKKTRVYEVLLCTLKPVELLWGKVIGRSLVSTLQVLIWVAALIIILMLLNNFVDVASTFKMEFKIGVFIYYVINYVVGLMIFLALYAGLAVAYDDSTKASSVALPVYFAILLPFYTFFSLTGNPANSVSEVLSIVPLTSLYVMPARMVLVNVPLWQPMLALVLNIGVLCLAMLAASRMYRISVLSTGNSPSLRQLVIWARRAQ